eukprot:scpid1751/ scgid6742/ 
MASAVTDELWRQRPSQHLRHSPQDADHQWLTSRESVNTVFLPRQLPQHAPQVGQHIGDLGQDGALSTFADINSGILPASTVNMITEWSTHYMLDTVGMQHCFSELTAHQTIAVHLVAQNAAMTFTQIPSMATADDGRQDAVAVDDDEMADMIIVRAYNVQPELQTVTSAIGPLTATTPTMSVIVSKDTVLSDTFIQQLISLQTTVFGDAIPKVKRQGAALDEPRDANSPKYVFEWLMSFLSALGHPDNTTVAIEKKVRDAVVFSKHNHSNKLPWRRNPAWLAFKFVLHATLVCDRGLDDGTLLYKTAMLQFMTAFLSVTKHRQDHDLLHQMLAKVSGRTQKLSTLYDRTCSPKMRSVLGQQLEAVLKESADAVVRANQLQAQSWDLTTARLSTESNNKQHLNTSVPAVHCATDRHLQLAASKARLSRMQVKSCTLPASHMPVAKSQHATRQTLQSLGNDSTGSTFSQAEQLSGVHDFEQHVLQLWQERLSQPVPACAQLCSWMQQYSKASTSVEKCKDPIGNGRRLLVGAVLAALCDEQATKRYPMLLHHQPHINVDSLNEILAVNKQMLTVATEVQQYFQHRCNAATKPGPLECGVSAGSISVCYARGSASMRATRDQLLAQDEAEKASHQRRVRVTLDRMACLKAERAQMEHQYGRVSKTTGIFRPDLHKFRCSACDKDKEIARQKERVFEAKLPSNPDEQLAVIFEAQVPDSLGEWRDVVFHYNSSFLKTVGGSSSYCYSTKDPKLWRNDIQLSYGNRAIVALGSTSSRVSTNHYSYIGVSHNMRIEDYIKPCQLNCKMFADGKVLGKLEGADMQKHRQQCSFKLSDCTLQGFLPACDHHQSEVIAQQSACPKSFSLQEFIAFGSLRAGERLQWFNILRGIHQRTLQLHQPETVQLICQAAWQAGKSDNSLCAAADGTAALRSAHQPCTDPAFVSSLTSQLSDTINTLQQNWQHHWALCSIVVLANRLYDVYSQQDDHSTSIVADVRRLLQFCRNVASSWLKKINTLMQQSTHAYAVQDLQKSAACIATFGILSFSHSAVLIEPKRRQGRTLQLWMRFVTELKNNTQGTEKSTLPSFLEHLRNLAVRVTIDRHADLVHLIENGFEDINGRRTHHELESYMNEFYTAGKCRNCKFYSDNKLWVEVEWENSSGKQMVEVDLRQGQFCINGLPQSRLTDDVITDDLYKEHFGGAVFMVKPCRSPHHEVAHVTEQWNDGSRFVFSAYKKGAPSEHVKIYELQDGKELVLIPKEWFTSVLGHHDIPLTLLRDYSLWMEIASGIVYFRSQSINEPGFHDLQNSAFTLDSRSGVLRATSKAPAGIGKQAVLLSQTSPVGAMAIKITSVLEQKQYTEVWQNADGSLLVRLPRFGLSFFANSGDCAFQSSDHKGWFVDSSQYLGTMLGLSSYLKLVKNRGDALLQQSCILVPHAKIKFAAMPSRASDTTSIKHHTVAVDTAELNEPPFFRYELNTTLKQLTGPFNRTAWVYLAALHAFTSSTFPDPFTCLTGMETAVEILQSSRCWAGLPLEQSSIDILQSMADTLSPKRSKYPSKSKPLMDIIDWPEHISPLCASDAYAILAQKLIEHNGKLHFLHGNAESAASAAKPDAEASMSTRLALLSMSSKKKKEQRPSAECDDIKPTEVAYLKSLHCYPLLACLHARHAPRWAAYSAAFSAEPTPSTRVKCITQAVVQQTARLHTYSVTDIEKALLAAPDDAGDRSEDGAVFITTITQEELKNCSLWISVKFPTHFFALQKYVSKYGRSRPLHTSLLLSFLAFQMESGGKVQPSDPYRRLYSTLDESHNASEVLTNVLIAMANSSADVLPPACVCYPRRRSSMKDQKASGLTNSFSESKSAYLLRHGVSATPPRSSSYYYLSHESDSDRKEREEWEEKRSLKTAQYEAEQKQILRAIEKDIASAHSLLSSPNGALLSHGYGTTASSVPALPFTPIRVQSFQHADYKSQMTSLLQEINKSQILLSYAARLSVALGELDDLDATLPTHVLLAAAFQLADRYVEQACLEYDYAHGAEPISKVMLKFWDKTEAKLKTGKAVPEDRQQPVERLDPLLEPLRHNSSSDPIVRDFAQNLEDSCKALSDVPDTTSLQQVDHESAKVHCLRSYHQLHAQADKSWQCLAQSLDRSCSRRPGYRALRACGLLRRCHPLTVFPSISRSVNKSKATGERLVDESFPEKLISFVGGLISCQVMVQHHIRRLRYLQEKQDDWYLKESRNVPHRAWTPREHPEWLLFELENDLCIWPRQVDVARQMMEPADEEHAVMQLNMGEGKTSVIMPIIAAELADGDALVRLIVLTSLLNTNCNQLIFKLGGLLNRRVLTLPFRRDIRLTSCQVSTILECVEDCRCDQGVIVTVREHLLSKQLKFYESCCKQDTSLSKELAKLALTFNTYARDIIDEADEVLHHRFQLVYPMGNRQDPDGNDVRWLISQIVLECVKDLAGEFAERFESSVNYTFTARQTFPFLRILDSARRDEAYAWLSNHVADKVLAGHGRRGVSVDSEVMDVISELDADERAWLKDFVLRKDVTAVHITRFNEKIPKQIHKAMLCLKGLLAHEILLLALQKRYRVEYGLLATTAGYKERTTKAGSNRTIQMAVPFRAKDVAAERTEFGHTDVAIMLTLLCYYQHGLTHSQIDNVFEKLERKDKSSQNSIYASWVMMAGRGRLDASITQLTGINRKDKAMMTELVYPFLQNHTAAVNFFLNHFIFPHQAKEFPEKLVGNAWSMTPSNRGKPVTGFSGTNDTRHLLPGSVLQRDLPSLQHTNAHVCKLVLDQVNDVYSADLPSQCQGVQLLEILPGPRTAVQESATAVNMTVNTLIDVGAVILDLTNEQVARTWLDLRPDKHAIVYFDDKNQLRVVDQQSKVPCKLELSPYASDLSECLVYLDHSHTRGTDLRMSMGTRAAVTLGKGLRRDEMVQACMRMRRLGAGHTLSFWAPPEIDRLIRERCRLAPDDPVHHYHVLLWCFYNSIDATKAGFLSWAMQGLAFLHTDGAMGRATDQGKRLDSSLAIDVLGKMCCLPDCMQLTDMYGKPREKQFIADIIAARGGLAACGIEQLVVTCRQFVPEVERYAQKLDEEQERELEQEVEEEKEQEKLPKSSHVKETCPQYLVNLAGSGDASIVADRDTCNAVPIWECLEKTSLFVDHADLIGSDGWSRTSLLATQSFANTILPHTLRASSSTISSHRYHVSSLSAYSSVSAYSSRPLRDYLRDYDDDDDDYYGHRDYDYLDDDDEDYYYRQIALREERARQQQQQKQLQERRRQEAERQAEVQRKLSFIDRFFAARGMAATGAQIRFGRAMPPAGNQPL